SGNPAQRLSHICLARQIDVTHLWSIFANRSHRLDDCGEKSGSVAATFDLLVPPEFMVFIAGGFSKERQRVRTPRRSLGLVRLWFAPSFGSDRSLRFRSFIARGFRKRLRE